MKDADFESQMEVVEREAWGSFKYTCCQKVSKQQGKIKNSKTLVENMLLNC